MADDNIIVGKEVKRMEVYVKTKKKIGLFVIIVAALAIMMIGFRWFFFEVLKSDQMLDGLVEFRASVVKDMESGSKSGMYFVKNVKKKDVPNINKYIDSAYGSVDTYRIIIESGDYLAIQFNFELSDNYYVVRKYLYGTDIPGDNERALRIYDVVDGFIDRYITDGMTDFDDVCELLEIQGEELEDFDTLSGFLISRINKIPVNGEHYQVSAYGYRFDVLLVEHRVIRTVRVTKEPLKEEKQILSE